MGTNYYLLTRKLKKEEYPEGGMHIGKNSCGWIFHFESHPSIKSVQDMREATKVGYIYNEYGEKISYRNFWKIVRESKEPYEDGSLPKGLTSEGIRMGDYSSDGYPFSIVEFS